MSEETKKKEALQRRQSDTSLSSSTKSSTDVSEGVKKSASFVVYDRHLLKEDLKLTSDADRLCSGMLPIGGKVKRDSLHSSISDPWINPEESISNAIESMLQSCKESPHMNLDQVKEKVSHIYSTVTQAVDSMLANVTVHAQPDAAKHTGLKVKGADEITVKLIDEENLCASQCSLSSPPNTAIGIRERSDSIETNKSSAPQSASSQRSINSPYPGQSCYSKRPGSMHMKKVNDLASHSASTASQRSIQSPEDNKCFSPNDTKETSVKGSQKPGYTFVNERELEVVCGCQLSPLIYNNKLYVPVTSTTVNDMLKIYNLVDGKEYTQEVKRTVSYAGCKMFYLKNISLLVTSSSTTKLRLYQLDTKNLTATWKVISCPSIQQLDHKNSISVPFKDNGVIVISVVNQQITSQIRFYIFSLSIAEKLKSASSNICYSSKYQIQSCAMLLNYIYCGLLLPDGAYIYKFDIASLQKETHGILSNHKCYMKNSTLQNFFLLVFREVILIISIFTEDNKSIMEIRQLLDKPEISSVKYQFEFPCVVKVVAASVIPDIQNPLIAVMYHNDKTGKCYIKKLALYSV